MVTLVFALCLSSCALFNSEPEPEPESEQEPAYACDEEDINTAKSFFNSTVWVPWNIDSESFYNDPKWDNDPSYVTSRFVRRNGTPITRGERLDLHRAQAVLLDIKRCAGKIDFRKWCQLQKANYEGLSKLYMSFADGKTGGFVVVRSHEAISVLRDQVAIKEACANH